MSDNSRRQPDLYWKQIQQIKAASICIRLYRNSLHNRVRFVDGLKAVASSGAIAGWVIWKQFPLVWSSVIVAAQLLDALKGVFPFSKQHKAASDLTIALETIWIDAEDEWESIFMGNLTSETISKRRTKLRKLQLEAERKHFPEGFAPSEKLIKMATEEAAAYFQLTYAEESTDAADPTASPA